MDRKDILLNKQRIVIKVGTSTITYDFPAAGLL